MKVKPIQLEVGCILAKDINSFSNQTLMRKKTVLDEENIAVLKAFLVEVVEVEGTLVNGSPFKPKEILKNESSKYKSVKLENKSFMDIYLQTVQTYKKLFSSWQAGSKVDIFVIRKNLLALLEKLDKDPSEIITIHHYASKGDYLFHHAVSVGLLSAYLGRKLNYTKPEEIQLGIAGMLADSGMAKVPNGILDKKGPLTSTEFDEIKSHSLYSYQMIKDIPGVTDAMLLGVLQHHEREDGSGYPMAISSQKLHKFSKVIAVIDVFHAMTTERYYKQKQSPYKVLEAVMKDSFGKFDIKIVQALANLIANFSIGSRVRLNNGEICEVVFLEPSSPIRPMLKIEKREEFIVLANRNDLYIEEILN